MAPIIEIENLSKQYARFGPQRGLGNLREAITNMATAPLRWMRPAVDNQAEDRSFWALKDINLQIQEGDVVGIVGPNGAGKSTLLKILSRITGPTSGRIVLRGRIASLLEVGTGFHPELTGRENIFLNGAMLGMKNEEIRSRFDEIVAFSEIEDFLDTPVKRYSSGMYVRLAFSVAAHLKPEILVVDEVLAVGDMAFQKKCLEKMSRVSSEGRTILFVSHNMAAVENLCTRGIVLVRGHSTFQGSSKEAVQTYLRGASQAETMTSGSVDLTQAHGRAPRYKPLLRRLELLDGDGVQPAGTVFTGQTLRVRIHARFPARTLEPEIGIGFENLFGQRLFTASTDFDPSVRLTDAEGDRTFLCQIPDFPLAPGEYKLKVFVFAAGILSDIVEDAARIRVMASDCFGTGRLPHGAFLHRSLWSNSEP